MKTVTTTDTRTSRAGGDFVSSISELNEVRAREPHRIQQLLAARTRRPLFRQRFDGRDRLGP